MQNNEISTKRHAHRIHPHIPAHSNRWLVLIGAGKLLKAAFFVALGFGLLHMVHRDLLSLVTRWITDLRFDPEGRFVNFVLDEVGAIGPHRLKVFSILSFCYAGVDVLEGTGLVLGKLWAEYLTLILSAALLPWELFSIAHKPTWPKAGLTLINVVVVIYLADYLQRRLREHRHRSHEALARSTSLTK